MAERNAKAVLKVAFPIGINIADIIIHDDVFGDGVNVARGWRMNANWRGLLSSLI